MGIEAGQRPWVVAAAALTLLAFAVTLATPYLPLPVGTATTTGGSMGHESMHVLVYVDPVLTGIEVGDVVVYRAEGKYIHHRVVAETDRGYVTRGDAVDITDQARGLPYATEENVVGVVVASVPISAVWRASAGLAALLLGLAALRWESHS